MLEASLESTSGLTTVRLRLSLGLPLLRLLWLLGIEPTAELTLSLTLTQRSHRSISTLVASLASGGQILIRGCPAELAVLSRGIQEVTIASTAAASTRWGWGSI